jgi:hypothetical protein
MTLRNIEARISRSDAHSFCAPKVPPCCDTEGVQGYYQARELEDLAFEI